MKPVRIAAPLSLLVVVGGTVFGLSTARQVDDRLTLEQLPPAVRQAFAAIADGAPATEVERIAGGVGGMGGMVAAYEIEYQRGGAESGVVVSELGEVIEIETAVTAADLPIAVRAGIERAFPGAAISEADSVQLFFYEVEFVHDGKSREVRVSATGRLHAQGAQSGDDGESDGDDGSADDSDSEDGPDDPDDKSDGPDDADSDDDRSDDPGDK